MLRYRFNINDVKNRFAWLELSDFTVSRLFGDGNEEKLILSCYCKEELPFRENGKILASYGQDVLDDNSLTRTAYRFNTSFIPSGINFENRSFSLIFDRFYDTAIRMLGFYETEEETEGGETVRTKWWLLYFNGKHLFDVTNGEIYKLYITYDCPGGFPSVIEEEYEDNILPDGLEILYVSDKIGKEVKEGVYTNAEVLTGTIIRVKYDVLFKDDTPTLLYNSLYYTENGVLKYNLSNARFFRDNFIFTTGMFDLYYDKPMTSLSLPLSSTFSTDLMEDDAIRTDFTNAEIRKAINSSPDMEKDVYHPVIWKTERFLDKYILKEGRTGETYLSEKQYAGLTEEEKEKYTVNDSPEIPDDNYGYIKDRIYKIRFNFHFRCHEGEDWIADNNSFWNGVTVNAEGKPEFVTDYFGAGFTNREELHSDLLYYLGFNNKDVRYQKNKLKKSFIRLMFFDSVNPANQNLLAYSTVFLDSGLYFSKYARYIEKEGYTSVEKNEDDGNYIVKKDLTGIKVDREPTSTSQEEKITNRTDTDKIEEVRLSSQITVRDKYSSDSSSEGFYLYLWKENFLGTYPQDLYMKIEFNHAGFGRTIPFMCPFNEDIKGFKSFSEILKDWDNTVNGEEAGYGIRKFLKYSYIHFKYKYDKVSGQHLYYLDDEFYGDSVYFKDNAITINLYEAKIS